MRRPLHTIHAEGDDDVWTQAIWAVYFREYAPNERSDPAIAYLQSIATEVRRSYVQNPNEIDMRDMKVTVTMVPDVDLNSAKHHDDMANSICAMFGIKRTV